MSADRLTIRSVTSRIVNAPLARPLRTASGNLPSAPLMLVDVVTEDDVTGRAYILGHSPVLLRALQAFMDNIVPDLAGLPLAPAERDAQFERRFRLIGRQGVVCMALSGLDMALWDALGQSLGQPVVCLLGGEARALPAYDSYGIVDPVEDRAALERSLEQGFKAIKIKLGGGSLALDVQRVAGVREIIGEEVELMVDYNQSLTVTETLRRINRLAEYDLAWLEEPVRAEDLEGHAAIRAVSPVPLQTGENWWYPADMAKAFAAEACDLAMPDLMKIGGITGWLGAMGMAQAASIQVSSHLFVEASAHVLPVTPTAHWLEYLDLAGAVLAEPLEIVDGCVTARGPGLGMNWDEDAVARYQL